MIVIAAALKQARGLGVDLELDIYLDGAQIFGWSPDKANLCTLSIVEPFSGQSLLR